MSVIGQETKERSTFSVSIDEGLLSFFGDLRFSGFHPFSIIENSTKYGMGLGVEKRLAPGFALQAKVNMGTLSGYEVDQNLYFESSMNEISINTRFYFRKFVPGQSDKKRFWPYTSLGFGILNYKTSLQSYDLRQVLNYPKDKTAIILPVSLGFNIRLIEEIDFNFDFGYRICSNDNIDAVKQGDKVDMYSYAAVGLKYRFGKRKKKIDQDDLVTPPVNVLDDIITENKDSVKTEEIDPVIIEEKTEIAEAANEENKIDSILIDNKIDETIIKEEEDPVKTITDIKEQNVVKQNDEEILETKIVPGIEYRLQIGASKVREDGNLLLKEHNIQEDLKIELHKGWYKFSIGSFNNLNDARKFMNRYISRRGFTSAFLIAFRDGVRLDKDKFPLK